MDCALLNDYLPNAAVIFRGMVLKMNIDGLLDGHIVELAWKC